jgi:hypothetical protein
MQAQRKLVSSLSGVAWAVRGLLPLSSCSACKHAKLTWMWSFPSPAEAREEVFWSLAVLVVVLLMRRLLMRVFSNSFGHHCTPGQSWAIEEAQEQVDRDTSVSRTPTVAPGSSAHERTLLRGRRVGGPQKLLGPPTGRVNRAVRGPCEDAEAADAWRDRS